MGLFDKVLNALYEDDTAPPSRKTPSGPAAQKAAPKAPVKNHPVVAENNVYQQFTISLKTAMENENLPGFDLYEFHQIYKSAVGEGKTSKLAFIDALKSSKTMRVSNESLVANYDHYNRVLNDQKVTFTTDMDKYYKSNIMSPKTDRDLIDRELNQKLAQYDKLGEEIEALKAQRKSVGLDTDSAENQINEVKSAFEKAYSEITHELRTIVDILKSLEE